MKALKFTEAQKAFIIKQAKDVAGWKIRVLKVVDTFSRDVPVLDLRICYPATIRVDQGREFISRDMDLWAYQRGVTLDFSQPGKPTDNAFIEAFNGGFRAGMPEQPLVHEP